MMLENTMTSSSQLMTGGPRNKTPDNYNNKGKMMIVSHQQPPPDNQFYPQTTQ
jgi:hypothetical protein